jgi:hypothetical protein
MSRIFKISACKNPQSTGGEAFCIGIPVRIAGRETVIPISESCQSLEEMVKAARDIQDELKLLLAEAEKTFQPEAGPESGLHFPPGMEPDKVWTVLSQLEEEEAFVRAFNQLEEERRGLVAEHVLTKCNIFSGRAAVFSARYNSGSGLLE